MEDIGEKNYEYTMYVWLLNVVIALILAPLPKIPDNEKALFATFQVLFIVMGKTNIIKK